MIRNRFVANVLAASVSILFFNHCSWAEEISFADRLDKAEKTTVVTIQANPGDVLLIEPGTYSLKGRRLILAASHVKIPGDVVLQSFDPQDTPAAKPGVAAIGPPRPTAGSCGGNGCRGLDGVIGATGAAGADGAPAEDFSINVGEIEGPGVLKIVTKGQTGGKGQKGGKGGNGGQGGRGSKRSCGGLLGLDTKAGPGDGGPGGRGGPGGVGGHGGTGGSSGSVLLNDNLFLWVALGRVVVDTSGGDPGEGGDPGDRGSPGLGNDGGEGNSCGGGGRGSGPGPVGELGTKGSIGKTGKPGVILYSRFNGEVPTEYPPAVQKVTKTIELSVDEKEGYECPEMTSNTEICVDQGRMIVVSRATLRSSEAVSRSAINFEPVPNKPVCIVARSSLVGLSAVKLRRVQIPSVSILGGTINVAVEALALIPAMFDPYCMKGKAIYDTEVLTLPTLPN